MAKQSSSRASSSKPNPKNEVAAGAPVKPSNKPGPWDDIARGAKLAGKVAYEVSGAGDAVRYVKNPSNKNLASLGLTVAAYAAGPVAKAAQATRAAKAVTAVNALSDVRAVKAVEKAIETKKVVLATKGLGTLETKAGSKAALSGIKSFTTEKNLARVAAGSKSATSAEAARTGKSVLAAGQSKVTAGKLAAATLAGSKAGSTVSNAKNKSKTNKR